MHRPTRYPLFGAGLVRNVVLAFGPGPEGRGRSDHQGEAKGRDSRAVHAELDRL